jgi:hypothetical protein
MGYDFFVPLLSVPLICPPTLPMVSFRRVLRGVLRDNDVDLILKSILILTEHSYHVRGNNGNLWLRSMRLVLDNVHITERVQIVNVVEIFNEILKVDLCAQVGNGGTEKKLRVSIYWHSAIQQDKAVP